MTNWNQPMLDLEVALRAQEQMSAGYRDRIESLETALSLEQTLSEQRNRTIGEMGQEIESLKAELVRVRPMHDAYRRVCQTLGIESDILGFVHGLRTSLAATTAERDGLLNLCREMRTWLRPEVIKEPDRTFFWKLVAAITKCETSDAINQALDEGGSL